MDAAQQRLETLFEAALDLTDPAARTAFLERECGADTGLRTRLERLLSAHGRSQAFFDECRPALALDEVADEASEAARVDAEVGRQIGPYKLLQKIGEGGCGVVYLAEQEKPVRRRVALKIIKLGMDTKNVIARFEAERQALALMEHPNIARVLDAGATETGRPYFVMELVQGIRITEYCDAHQLEPRARLELFVQVCHAIQHAHQKGIIHRDIKPSNILVTLHDGVPVPKVIDFGIAKAIEEKLTDKTLFTIYGHFIGTPAYMSPEQAELSGLDIDTRSDIYSLGVLLYELLTGRTPFEQNELLAAGLDEMRRTLREREPHRPSTRLDTMQTGELTVTALRRHVEPPKLRLLLKGDLDWIVMKALEKDRRRRYETANGLAMDVRRFLDNEPVLARPPGRWYRFQKLVRRNRGLFAAVGAVSLALVLGLGAATWMFFKERAMRQRAVASEQQAELARANEAELRHKAETREQITQAAFLISQGKMDAADRVAARTVFTQPSLEGAAVLRALGEWLVENRQWPPAGERYLQLLEVNQLDGAEAMARDFFAAAAVLAKAGETNRLAWFQQQLAARFDAEKNPTVMAPVLLAALLAPGQNPAAFHQLAAALAPDQPASIGNARSAGLGQTGGMVNPLPPFQLVSVGMRNAGAFNQGAGLITLVAGGADIWNKRDECAYVCNLTGGDFDFCMQVLSIEPKLDNFTRVGLMAREAVTAAGSRHVMVAVNAEDSFQVVMRSVENALSDSVPHDPLPKAYGANSWVRLQRVGAIFHAYTSSNGVDWAQLYQTTGGDKPFSDPIYFGIAAASHATNAVATNLVSHFGPTPTVSVTMALALALWESRNAHDAAAMTWCRRLLVYPECRPVESVLARIIMALAAGHAGQPELARQQLEIARLALEKHISAKVDPGNAVDGFWPEWLFAQALLAEAERAGD